MEWFHDTNRNDQCFCGSGKKLKHCCGRLERTTLESLLGFKCDFFGERIYVVSHLGSGRSDQKPPFGIVHYVGQTSRSVGTRMREHMYQDDELRSFIDDHNDVCFWVSALRLEQLIPLYDTVFGNGWDRRLLNLNIAEMLTIKNLQPSFNHTHRRQDYRIMTFTDSQWKAIAEHRLMGEVLAAVAVDNPIDGSLRLKALLESIGVDDAVFPFLPDTWETYRE